MLLHAIVFFAFISNHSFGQTIQVSGKVRSKANGEVLVGASVTLKGSANTVQTDVLGSFSIAVPQKGAILLISYTGLKTVSVSVGSKNTSPEILMEETNGSLSEVVVVGYGTKKRRDLTTAVSSISSKEINSTPVADARSLS